MGLADRPGGDSSGSAAEISQPATAINLSVSPQIFSLTTSILPQCPRLRRKSKSMSKVKTILPSPWDLAHLEERELTQSYWGSRRRQRTQATDYDKDRQVRAGPQTRHRGEDGCTRGPSEADLFRQGSQGTPLILSTLPQSTLTNLQTPSRVSSGLLPHRRMKNHYRTTRSNPGTPSIW